MSCPQGATMSPILWNVDIADVIRLDLGENCHSQAFADDSNLCVLSDNLIDLENDTNTLCKKCSIVRNPRKCCSVLKNAKS